MRVASPQSEKDSHDVNIQVRCVNLSVQLQNSVLAISESVDWVRLQYVSQRIGSGLTKEEM